MSKYMKIATDFYIVTTQTSKQNRENSSLCNLVILLQKQLGIIKIQNTGRLPDNINMYASSNLP